MIFTQHMRIKQLYSTLPQGVSMFLAYDIKYIDADKRMSGVVVLTIWVVLQLACHLGFELLSWRLKGKKFTNG